MSKAINFTVVAVLVITAGILMSSAAWTAVGQTSTPSQGIEEPAAGTDQPYQSGVMPDDTKESTEAVKISEPMKMCCGMMMKMEVTSQDPAALLALKDQLKLTEEQVKQLEAIVTQSRLQAGQLLTDQQKTQLEPLEKLPTTMVEMHRKMIEKMGPARNGMKRQFVCPMMEQLRCEPSTTENTDNK